jgi:CubicO group peptidase (beta-lactamase class C family)
MKSISFATALILTAAVSTAADLPRSSPEAQGLSSSAILAFVQAADKNIDSLHSIMIVRHGHVVAEGWWTPYTANDRHQLYSLSKSFTSTAVGLAIAEGKLSLDDEGCTDQPKREPEVDADSRSAPHEHRPTSRTTPQSG